MAISMKHVWSYQREEIRQNRMATEDIARLGKWRAEDLSDPHEWLSWWAGYEWDGDVELDFQKTRLINPVSEFFNMVNSGKWYEG